MATTETKQFDINKHLVALLMQNSFYGEISRRIHKVSTTRIPTAGVTWNTELDNIVLYYNPNFMSTLSDYQINGVLIHEFLHLIFGHLTARRMKPHNIHNIATDLAINSLIYHSAKVSVTEQDENKLPLPAMCLVPGRAIYQTKDKNHVLTQEEKDAQPMAKLIESLPQLLASEVYFAKIYQVAKDMKAKCPMCGGTGKMQKGDEGDKQEQEQNSELPNNSSEGQQEQQNGSAGGNSEPSHGENDNCPFCNGEGEVGAFDSFDNHDMWDEMTEEQKEYVKTRVRNIVEKAVHKADSSNGWGNIPADIAAEIRRSVSNIVPWRSVLRQFIGTILPGDRTTSIKKINKRFQYIHPGIKKNRRPKLLIAIDQSGSVDDEMLSVFFGELTNLAKNCDIFVLPFDCHADEKDIYRWRKGSNPPKGRQKSGGTDFNAPSNIVNSPQNRGKYDGFLIITDGEAPEPKPSRVKRGWVIAQDHKLIFDTRELQVFIDKNKPMQGAWR